MSMVDGLRSPPLLKECKPGVTPSYVITVAC